MSIDSTHDTHSFVSTAGRSGEAALTQRSAGQRGGDQEVEYGFRDLLDVLNPLHHIPIVSNIYRDQTGAEIQGASRILGGALFGGPIGMVLGLINAIADEHTGNDVAGHAIALFRGDEAAGDIDADALALAGPSPEGATTSDPAATDPTVAAGAEAAARRALADQMADAAPIDPAEAGGAPAAVQATQAAERGSRLSGGFAVPPRTGPFGPIAAGMSTRNTALTEAATLADHAGGSVVPSSIGTAPSAESQRARDTASETAAAAPPATAPLDRPDPLAALPQRPAAEIDDRVDAALRALMMATQQVEPATVGDDPAPAAPADQPLAGIADGRADGTRADGLAGDPMMVPPEAVPEAMMRALDSYQRAAGGNGGAGS